MIPVDTFISLPATERLRYGQTMIMEHYEPDLSTTQLIHIEDVPTCMSGNEQVVHDYLHNIHNQQKTNTRSVK
jgi:hypothetical protein